MDDLRKIGNYLTEEEKKMWDKQNTLYNTLWFDSQIDGPDIEFCDFAVKLYKKNIFFSEWKVIKHGTGKSLETPSGIPISADLMTGWWNPFKRFLGKSGSRNEIVKQCLCELKKENIVKKSDKEVAEWIAAKYGRCLIACESCIDFLKVVYSLGNIMPAATNIRPGSSLDGWDTKLSDIRIAHKEQSISKKSIKPWIDYITKEFITWEKFIEVNKLQMFYAKDDKKYETVMSLWGKNVRIRYATDEDWTNYFNNAYARILTRTAMLECDGVKV